MLLACNRTFNMHVGLPSLGFLPNDCESTLPVRYRRTFYSPPFLRRLETKIPAGRLGSRRVLFLKGIQLAREHKNMDLTDSVKSS